MNLELKAEIINSYDVIVAGAGPAGLCAAMSAAREGKKVALVERHGVVGGNLVTGHVGPIMGGIDYATMAGEINNLLNGGSGLHHDIEATKIKLINWIHHENISLFLLTPIVDVVMNKNRITGLAIGTQNGLKLINGRIIIDATGDGLVSYLAGADVRIGRDEDGLMQPATIMFTIEGIDEKQTIACNHEADETMLPNGGYLELCKKACRNGELPSTVNIVRLYETSYCKTERIVNATQENKINGLNCADIAKAELNLRNQIDMVVKFLKKNVWGFENCRIKDSADAVGIRETRRVMGEYLITAEDLLEGKKFADVMVHNANFAIDIHNPSGAGQSETDSTPHTTKSYDLPYRAFVPLKIEGLYTCGRCISGDHRAHASYRVMNIAMATGEAVGIGASLCLDENCNPRFLDYRKIQEVLRCRGVDLFD